LKVIINSVQNILKFSKMKIENFTAIILARGGSKAIKLKNL